MLGDPALLVEHAPRRRRRRALRAALYAAGFGVPVGLLAYLVRVRVDGMVRLDEQAVRAGTDLARSNPDLLSALLFWQELTQPRWVYLLAGGVCAIAFARGMRSRALWAFVTMMIGWNLALDLKLITQRARPVVEDAVAHAPGYSFPSGHAANITIAVTTLVLAFSPLLPRSRGVLIALGALVVVTTAVDRVMLGAHYPSDVVGGIVFGLGLVLASHAGFAREEQRP